MSKKNGHDTSASKFDIPLNAVACVNCSASMLQRTAPPNIGSMRVCKRLPPVPVNVGKGIVSLWPVVPDVEACGEFSPNEIATKAASQAANDGEKIATGDAG